MQTDAVTTVEVVARLGIAFRRMIWTIISILNGIPKYLSDTRCIGTEGRDRDLTQVVAVGLAVLNGTADPLVPYDGGQITLFRRQPTRRARRGRGRRPTWCPMPSATTATGSATGA